MMIVQQIIYIQDINQSNKEEENRKLQIKMNSKNLFYTVTSGYLDCERKDGNKLTKTNQNRKKKQCSSTLQWNIRHSLKSRKHLIQI